MKKKGKREREGAGAEKIQYLLIQNVESGREYVLSPNVESGCQVSWSSYSHLCDDR